MAKIEDIWSDMETEKGDLITRAEAYARWTLPSVCPPGNTESVEQEKGSVDVGAEVDNHLSNRIVDLLFPVSRPFFTLATTPEADLELYKELDKDQSSQFYEQVTETTSRLEKIAIRTLDLTHYRPVAVMAAKGMVITGNALIRRMPSGKRIEYGIKRFGVRRNIEGEEYEVIMHDMKRLDHFSEKEQVAIKTPRKNQSLKDSDEVILLTHYLKQTDGRWQVMQEANGVTVGKKRMVAAKDYDLIVLAWDLHSGENYGRGLVEQNASLFHRYDVTNEAVTELMAILCDLKFLVRPGSTLAMEVGNLARSQRGSYHVGAEGDITVPQVGKFADLQTMINRLDTWEQRLRSIFLMSSVRDAERVTAEEIRMIAAELESSFGGLYSRLAVVWQEAEAKYAMRDPHMKKLLSELDDIFEVVITTGVESLSREGVLDNLRLAIADLQMLDSVPEEVRAEISPLRFARHVFSNRYVDFALFMKTKAEKQEEAQQRQQELEAVTNAQTQANVAEHAGKAAVDQA